MALVEVLYPFGGHNRGDTAEVPDDKVGALRRLKWAREITASASLVESGTPTLKPRARKVKVQEKEPGIDAILST